jgi:hypothetical protein
MFSDIHKNINRYKLSRPFFSLLLFVLSIVLQPATMLGQVLDSTMAADTLFARDSLTSLTDTILIDTLTIGKKDAKKPFLEGEVKYAADDSLIFSIGQKKVYLFDKASVNYGVENLELKADHIEYDFGQKTVTAAGAIDSSGALAGKPVFTKDEEKFDVDTIRYNFNTRKAFIKSIITKQGEGFVHSSITKRYSDGEIHMRKGKYTTCDAAHPHFYIALTKAISIPKKRTISGPAYLVFEDIPVPLGLPFGFFPNTNTRTSGLILPDFRDEQRRGFGLENGGWYFALGEHVDFTVLGSVYSRGTWGVSSSSAYLVRYKFSGQFRAQYFKTQIKDDPSTTKSQDFKVVWSHSQDQKANPTRKFSANVDFSTHSFEKRQSNNIDNLLTNQKNSSISFAKNWPGRPFNFTANMNGSQSSKTRMVSLNLPSMTFNMNRIYPFRGKNEDGKYNWLENIQVSYSSRLENRINTPDSLLFTKNTLKNMRNGFSHSIPISLAGVKLLKIINITPGITYNGVLFPSFIRKTAYADTSLYRTNEFKIDTIHKLTYAHAFSTSLGISASPKIYGMFVSTSPNSYIAAVRHVITPTASVSFAPDMSNVVPDYYREVAYPASVTQPVNYNEYSVYEGQIYGTPSVNGRSGGVSLGLNNNLEMKVRSKSDTTGEGKKIVILDNLNLSARYNPFAEKFKWSMLNLTGSTSLFKNKLNLQFNSTFDPYALDTSNKRVDKFQFNETGKFFRTTNASIGIGFRLQSATKGKSKGTSSEVTEEETVVEEPYPGDGTFNEASGAFTSEYVDFEIPWSVSIDYSWSYSKPLKETYFTHTIRLNGDISITPKWKIGGNTGYDFVANDFSITNISIHRDLHCWEMSIGVVPFGNYRSYSLTISAKSSILRDLKYDKRKSWTDNY